MRQVTRAHLDVAGDMRINMYYDIYKRQGKNRCGKQSTIRVFKLVTDA